MQGEVVEVGVPREYWPSRGEWEGTVVAVHVAVGDRVSEGQVVAEVELEKAVLEVESPVSGVVVAVHVAVGDKVGPGDPLVSVRRID